jgi:hypothetical protein
MKPHQSLKDIAEDGRTADKVVGERRNDASVRSCASRAPSRVRCRPCSFRCFALYLSAFVSHVLYLFKFYFSTFTSPTGKFKRPFFGSLPHPYLLPSVESVPSSSTISSNGVTHGQQEHLQLTVPYDISTQTATKFVVDAERRIPVALPKMHCTRLTLGEVHTLSSSCIHLLILRMPPV